MKDFHIQWHITEICNLDCFHCYKEPHREELSLFQLKNIIDNIIEFLKERNLTLILTITGGEPFLKPNLYELLEYIDKIELIRKINFITNGIILPSDNLKRIKKLNTIYISIEGISSSINDKIRGEGNFKKVFSNINYFVENYKNIGIMTTLMRTNFFHIKESFYFFIKEFFKLGIKEIIFERFIPVGKAKYLKNEMLSQEEIFEFYSVVSELLNVDFEELKKYPAVKIVNPFKGTFNPHKLLVYGANCIFGKDGFAVLCDGTVYPCRRFDEEIGNFLKNQNNFIFLDEKINHLKMNNNSKCFFCYAAIKN
ncbi:MAG: radical SAM protein [Endomicrobia bacterium]|nr:radical SAM protein [Endomicrobiia bacterium]